MVVTCILTLLQILPSLHEQTLQRGQYEEHMDPKINKGFRQIKMPHK